jgi:hypothetical protein
VTQRLDSFVDFCRRARTLESSTNDSNLFDESFDESFAFWVFKITQNTQFKKVLVENNTKSISAIQCMHCQRMYVLKFKIKYLTLIFNTALSDKKKDE